MSHNVARSLGIMLAMSGAIAAATAGAQAWPSKPVRIVVPFSPGGGTDIQGRLLAKKFTESMSQTFLVDNRSGAAGLIGAEIVAKSPPDSSNVLFTTASLAETSAYISKVRSIH